MFNLLISVFLYKNLYLACHSFTMNRLSAFFLPVSYQSLVSMYFQFSSFCKELLPRSIYIYHLLILNETNGFKT